jgi:hypothetical protein
LRYLLLGLGLLFLISDAIASEVNERRIEIGLSLFPRVLAVDMQFHNKLNDDKKARLAFVYVHDKDKATLLAKMLASKNSIIANVPVRAVAVSVDELKEKSSQRFTGMFVVEKLSTGNVEQAIQYSVKNSVILFSPFSGDVERGVSIGLLITSRVWPYLNNKTIKNAGIQLNELLVKISKQYE